MKEFNTNNRKINKIQFKIDHIFKPNGICNIVDTQWACVTQLLQSCITNLFNRQLQLKHNSKNTYF